MNMQATSALLQGKQQEIHDLFEELNKTNIEMMSLNQTVSELTIKNH